MKRDPNFDVSADMRLLELSRDKGSAPVKSRWQSRRTTVDIGGPDSQEPADASTGHFIVATLHATPTAEVIPGTLMTVTLALVNEGSQEARQILIGAPPPGGARIRPGSLAIDGRNASPSDTDDFFGAGLTLSALAGGSRSTFLWSVEVQAGIEPLLLTANVRSQSGAVSVPRSVRVTRRLGSSAAFVASVAQLTQGPELPIYELDEEEQLIAEAVSGPYIKETPPTAPAPAPAPAPPQLAAQEREVLLLTTNFDRASVSYFERIFNGSKSPTVLDHLTFCAQLACVTQVPASPEDSGAIRKHQEAQAQLLARIALHERLKRRDTLQAYAGSLDCSFDTLQPRQPNASFKPSVPTSAAILGLEPSDVGLATLRRLADPKAPWDFLRARQMTHALLPTTVLNAEIAINVRALSEQSFRAYAQASANSLQRLFVRQRIEKSTAVLLVNDQALDASARQVLLALAAIAR